MAKRFVNVPSSVVKDFLRGVSLDSDRITLVNPEDGKHHVGILTSIETGPSVRVISGGGAGHEPAFLGYVAKGMLSGAVTGEVFASPSSPAISTCIEAVANSANGILIILMNYTGDRLNFGLAVEQFKLHQKLPTSVVIVKDDIVKGRGIAGNVFVLKAAGAAAAEGKSLQEVERIAENAAASVFSIGVALTAATLPGESPDKDRLQKDEIEVGMGIHNEPGVFKQTISSMGPRFCASLVQDLIARLAKAVEERPSLFERPSVLFMVNNLGSVPPQELEIISACVAEQVYESNKVQFCDNKRIFFLVGTFMTSLDMNGVSISAFMMDEELERLVLSSCEAPAWRKPFRVLPPENRPTINTGNSDDCKPYCATQTDRSAPKWKETEHIIKQVLEALRAEAETLTKYDAKVGDGDCGTTLLRGILQMNKDLERGRYDLTRPSKFLKGFSEALGTSMGGTSGALYSIFFTAASASFLVDESWHKCFQEGTASVMKHGGASVGSRTMVDALSPAAESFKNDSVESLRNAVQAAKTGANSTANMTKALAGRSEYVNEENLKGIPDPGAVAVSIAMESLLRAIN